MRRTALLFVMAASLQAAGPFQFREISPSSLELTENGKPVWVYNYGPMLKDGVSPEFRRSTYLHPVYAPDGTVLTDDFPKDHPHHRGICWSWPIVNFEGQTYDVWAVKGMYQRFVGWKTRQTLPDRAVLSVENGWFIGERKVMKETVMITVRPAAGNRRQFDVSLVFEAVDLPVGITGREIKGYGGFGFRFAPRDSTILRSDDGVEAKDSDMAEHRWAELEGVFAGHRAGARIESLSGTPGWCLRNYGYVAANFPGLDSYTIRPGKPLRLSYRVTVFSAT